MVAVTCNFPFDVWEYICSFLPQETVGSLYPINASLLHLALNSRYQTIELASFNDHKMFVLKHRLCDLNIGRRVLALTFRTWDVFTSHEACHTETIFSPAEIIHALECAVPIMTNVIEFHIYSKNHVFSQDLIPFFSKAWRTFGTNLQTLVLDAPLARCTTLLSVSAGFDALTSLRLAMDDDNNISQFAARKLQETVIMPIINRVDHQLHTLEISMPHDLSPLLEGIRSLPRVHTLAFSMTFTAECASFLSHFFARRCPQLRHLTWSCELGSTNEMTALSEWFGIHQDNPYVLGGLEKASLRLPGIGPAVLFPSLTHSITSLATIKLDQIYMSPAELDHFVGLFHGPSPLRSLSIGVTILSPMVIAALGTLPTTLAKLKLQFRTVEDSPSPSSSLKLLHSRSPPILRKLGIYNLAHLEPSEFSLIFIAFLRHFPSMNTELKMLNLSVHTLNPHLINTLALNLPSLESLTVQALGLACGSRTANASSSLVAFQSNMSELIYPDWKLRQSNISVQWLNGAVVSGMWERCEEVMEVLEASVPSLRLARKAILGPAWGG
ncbi:hypothetical protein DL96DRAFT_369016 [Flagelloscypha sp. PMI_526]|nr:hypothetical protein DL96DRAFT_369016 [Flagelloscypha sp. PMI_526]